MIPNPAFASPTAPTAPTAPGFSAAPGTEYLPRIQNPDGAKEFLSTLNWPAHLQDNFLKSLEKLPIRYFICDDSGSMSAEDGSIAVASGENKVKVSCSRWKELATTLKFHVKLAKDGCIPSEFRFLNSSGPLRIGFDPMEPVDNYNFIMNLLDESCPGGGTPLCRHINEICENIRYFAPALRATGQKAVVVINTDGEPSDGSIEQVLRPFKDLPAWVVLRFCTNEDKIVEKWNKVENDLELNMDVLDDFFGEAKEIHEHNPWFSYGEPLHRMREFGVTLKELDNIDEAALSADDMMRILKLIFGPVAQSLPHPHVDLGGFVRELNKANSLVPKVWNPINRRVEYWVDAHKIERTYGKKSGGGCVIL